MDAKELRKKDIAELQKMMESLDHEVSDAYFEMRTGKAKNVRKPRVLRKHSAILRTILAEKQRAKLKGTKIDG